MKRDKRTLIRTAAAHWRKLLSWAVWRDLLRQHPLKIGAFLGLLLAWLCCLPASLFNRPLCIVLEDRNGDLLGARIATDGQWRFPVTEQVPQKYVASVIAYEDKRFRYHPGFDPVSFGRALWLNLKNKRVVSGGSTLTMQVIRLSRQNPPRTIWEKLLEIAMATRLEWRFSKDEILSLYAAHAPFGGNVVGLEAASWRYYGKKTTALSWAEAATLAVLPNSPALIHPGRNRDALRQKRNRLLEKLCANGQMDAAECDLAMSEPLPEAPLPLPQLAPHLLDRLMVEYPVRESNNWRTLGGDGFRFRTTIDRHLQERVTELLARRQEIYRGNEVHNLAAVVLDVNSGALLAYVGNVVGAGADHGESVDVIAAPRSTGSILKPYLYALALESGDILPKSLLRDVPTQMGRYKPENYYETYDGAVTARRALIRSLNVPFVLLLHQYGLEKYHYNLKRLGISTLNKGPEHYGLSLILGGAEANLLDITNVYASMGRVLGNFYERNGRYDPHDFRKPTFLQSESGFHRSTQARASAGTASWWDRQVDAFADASPDTKASLGTSWWNRNNGVQVPPSAASAPRRAAARRSGLFKSSDLLSAGAIWYTFEAMQEVERPTSAGEWDLFRAGRRVAWKTGTSFGFRDAWAAGVTPQYAVGVWVGNADGEGRPGLIGVDMAAPVLFDIFNQLPSSGRWFDPPYDDMVQTPVCRQSGFRAGTWCEVDTVWIPKSGLRAAACPYHQLLHLDAMGQWQVNSDCASPAIMQHRPWFVLPPLEEYYFKSKNPWYVSPPPFRADCLGSTAATSQTPMQLIYPKHPTKIYVPVDLDGKLGSTVFQVAHRKRDIEVFWHLDGNFLGSTTTFHEMALQPPVGPHVLTLVDKDGFRLEEKFEIVGK